MIFRENERTELKQIYVEDIRKEIIAFANTNGGTIYIGVADDGTITGIDQIDSVNLQLTSNCRDSIKPDVMMFVQCEHISQEGKDILAIHVQRGTSRPYYISSKGLKPSGVYVRQGTASAPASEAAIRQMIKESDGDHFEDMRSLNQELTFQYAEMSFSERNMPLGQVQMKSLGLLNSENIYTNLALLLSDQCPHIIKTATFHGTSKEEFQDRKEFSGSLLKQLNDAYSYLDFRNQKKATFHGLLRTDTLDYSDTALRESLLNAIVHRDYSLSASTLISVYDNRAEFISFGGLTGGVTLDDILSGLSICRNPKLANIFYRLQLIEAYGTGLKKIQDSYKDFDVKPEFKVSPNSFKVVLPNRNTAKTSVDFVKEHQPFELKDIQKHLEIYEGLLQQMMNAYNSSLTIQKSDCINKTNSTLPADGLETMVLQYLSEHISASRAELENLLGISSSSTVRLINRMKKDGFIESTGQGKNTRYKRI